MKKTTKAAFLAASILGAAGTAPAWAQSAEAEAEATSGNDIIVTAQRIEQRLQDVPISITVLSQDKLNNNNVANIKDIAAFTPSLTVNARYGNDNTTFAIRGFTQDQRTFSTVGVFFADVVALRGSGASLGGDGAGPGALFDLQNVQVLKGPQGTLFGRNVTGGAVLLVPRKPTDKFEGYVEGSAGNYDMWRVQGVVNIPVSDSFKLRFGADHMDRKGYLKNIGRLGDGRYGDRDLGDVNFTAFRASALADLSPDVENYTVLTVGHSQSNGIVPHVSKCRPGVVQAGIPLGDMACVLRDRLAGSFWNVANRLPDNQSTIDQWQLINTITWKATDNLTVKYISAYGELRGTTNLAFYGDYFIRPGVTPGTEQANQVTGFAFTHVEPVTGHSNAQSSLVQELQFQGTTNDGRLTWQAGAYFEKNDPLGFSSSQTATLSSCPDINTFNCISSPGFSLGLPNFQLAKTRFTDYAFYGQATYKITDRLSLTAGIRHTWDKVESELHIESISLATQTASCSNPSAADFALGPRPIADRFGICRQDLSKTTKAPTWTINLDYKAFDDVLVYAKWSRGYRQGGLAMFGPDGVQKFDAEQVDTYEGGLKANWRGSVPGFFNFAGFYNDFRDQQLLLGVQCDSSLPNFKGVCNPNAAIVNAGKSRLWGVEAELGATVADLLHLSAAYSYLNAKIVAFTPPTLPATAIYNAVSSPLPTGPGGAPLTPAQRDAIDFFDTVPGTVPHKLSLAATLDLPLPESIGKVSVGGTFIYTSKYRIQTDADPIRAPNVGVVPGSKVINLNVNWENVAGMPVDAGFFMTNLTNEEVYLQSVDSLAARGFAAYLPGEPRMWGFRLKYRFGQ